ncbi:MAG: hypothetical protein QOC87_2 [Actinomycetota bacterium]|nr:hypothetical protein [Actinomycetota bacterium]
MDGPVLKPPGGPHEASGNVRPRWMVAGTGEGRCGHRIRLIGRLQIWALSRKGGGPPLSSRLPSDIALDHGVGCSANRIFTVVPAPGALCMSTYPPWASAIRRVM